VPFPPDELAVATIVVTGDDGTARIVIDDDPLGGPSILLATGDVDEVSAAELAAAIIGAAGARNLRLSIESPSLGTGQAAIHLTSGSQNGAESPEVEISNPSTGDLLMIDLVGLVALQQGVCVGSATLVAGTVNVANTATPAAPWIFVQRTTAAGVLGHLTVSAFTAGVGFTVTSSSATDPSTFDYLMVQGNP